MENVNNVSQSYLPPIIKSILQLFLSKEIILVIFLTAGYFKADERFAWLDIDLTLLAAISVSVIVLTHILKGKYFIKGGGLKRDHYLILCFFILFIPSLFWTEYTSYALSKIGYFFTLTLLAAISPAVIITSYESLRRVILLLVIEGGVMAIECLFQLWSNFGDLFRLSAFSATTIATGRALGVSILSLIILGLAQKGEKRLYYGLIILIVAILTISLVATGSRGPLFFLIISIGLYIITLNKGRMVSVAGGMLFLTYILIFALGQASEIMPEWSLNRINSFIDRDYGNSETERVDYAQVALEAIPEHPFGLGLGGFGKLDSRGKDDVRPFVHNILLEVTLEGGWVCGVCFCYLLFRGGRNNYMLMIHNQDAMIYSMLFIILIYLFLNDMVSGELGDSRLLFFFIGLSVSFKENNIEKLEEQNGH